jgi:hypothetical protein
VPVYQLLPGATSVKMPDGTTIAADRRGRIRVDDDAARAISGSAAKRRYDAIQEVATGFRGIGGPDAPECRCGFSPWSWQKSCPRCGSDLEH